MTLSNNIKQKLINTFKKKPALGKLPEGYLGYVDEISNTCVSGWILSEKAGANPVALKITKGDEVQLVLANDQRKDVMQLAGPHAELCGYSACFSENNFANVVIEVMSPIAELTKIAPNYSGRKIFFIHIPKAAGSSVNDCISSSINGVYYTHIEGLRNRWDEIADSQFLSGHIRYGEYERNFSHRDYVVFAFLREPLSHIKSHMNWVRRLSEPELINDRKSHSPIIHEIADKLAELEFSNANQLKAYVENLKPTVYGLFDNCQVRYLSDVEPNERVTEKHLKQAVKNLQHLHFVGISEYSKESQRQLMSLFGLKMTRPESKTNVNSYDYGLNLGDLDIVEAIQPLVQFDFELYKIAKARFLKTMVND
jgi:hypothetical protein